MIVKLAQKALIALWAVGLAAAALTTAPAQAIEIKPVLVRNSRTYNTARYGPGYVLVITGKIQLHDEHLLERALRDVAQSRLPLFAVSLHSPGGNMWAGLQLAKTVLRWKVNTAVIHDKECASACVMVWAAGRNRLLSASSGMIGVHQGGDASGAPRDNSDDTANVQMAEILRLLDVPPAVIGKMITTPRDKIAWVTPDDLRGMSRFFWID